MPDGAAKRDNRLRQGDVLVYVNNECVLGYTHQDVVEIFQSIPVGKFVELTVCRGYPLSIDPNDPNIEIMPLAAINNPNNTFQHQLQQQQQQQNQQQQQQQHQQQTTTTTTTTSSSTSTLIAPLAAVDELTSSTLVINEANTVKEELATQQQEQHHQPGLGNAKIELKICYCVNQKKRVRFSLKNYFPAIFQLHFFIEN